jgi:hypothetical protein
VKCNKELYNEIFLLWGCFFMKRTCYTPSLRDLISEISIPSPGRGQVIVDVF